ncbi:MAG: hypothetical protein K0S65_5811 [Labilithrix sp.]|nr:hypothetical protein [Labilithrix sp.]
MGFGPTPEEGYEADDARLHELPHERIAELEAALARATAGGVYRAVAGRPDSSHIW